MSAAHDAQSRRTEEFIAHAMADWGDAVYRLALGQTRSKADAEDVYQDVFMRLYSDTTVFTSDEHLKAWLLRVAINRCRDLAKSNWNRRTVAFDPIRDDVAELVRDPADADVWDAVGQLPDNLRSSVHLHYVEGYTTEEIARMLNSQPATVRTWLSRARARVKDLLLGRKAREGMHATSIPLVVANPCDSRKEVPHD
ncbi:RNA polymerase sigma factor [Eggerthella sinensis]|uniref:RNA polymerase sigma factor n=1 Tax=Eggerthella sinensis TaxID=242230 RepID=UPI0022E8B365|nr:sigma-70 family RNA polymerase sigma factor [Eggerthella sinensis]